MADDNIANAAADESKKNADYAANQAKAGADRAANAAKSGADALRDGAQKAQGAFQDRVVEPAKRAGEAMKESGQKIAEGGSTIGRKMIDQAEQNAREAFAAMREEDPGRLPARAGNALDVAGTRDRRADHAVRPRCGGAAARQQRALIPLLPSLGSPPGDDRRRQALPAG